MNKEQFEKLMLLAKNGYGNRQMAVELGMKHSHLLYLKRKLKKQGIDVPCIVGRPKKPLIGSISEMNRIDNE